MTQDFERTWQYKFQQSMLCRIDTEITKQILDGAEHLSDQSSRAHVIEWSQCAITRLEGVLPVGSAQEVFIECACHYPHEALQSLRDAYLQGGDIPQIQSMLLESFREFLEDDLKLEMDEIETVFENGWGLAGLLEGDTILATKIPKSNMLRDYLIEDDPQLR